jgi:hypothetical protein
VLAITRYDGRVLLDDAETAALARHGSSGGLATYDTRLLNAASKRSKTLETRSLRAAEVDQLAYSEPTIGWFDLFPDLGQVKAAYVKSGSDAAFDAVLAALEARKEDVANREREMRALGWDADSSATPRGLSLKDTHRRFALFGSEEDRGTLTSFLDAWRALLDVWRGARFAPLGPLLGGLLRKMGDTRMDRALSTFPPGADFAFFERARALWDLVCARLPPPLEEESALFLSPKHVCKALIELVRSSGSFGAANIEDAARWVAANALSSRKADACAAVNVALFGGKKKSPDRVTTWRVVLEVDRAFLRAGEGTLTEVVGEVVDRMSSQIIM